MSKPIPVALFAYARADHLQRTLSCLRENEVPLIYAFSDAPRTSDRMAAVNEVRALLRNIDWCEVRLVERSENLGLGRSIRTGVTEVLNLHDTVIVFEDDLICVPGTYAYLCAALNRYRNEQRVMSVTGWTHPDIRPSTITDKPYFDGRAECWVWGTWARAWEGMDKDSLTLIKECKQNGINPYQYGADLAAMAEVELRSNIWAVRFLYHHIRHHGLCLRPPKSMVEHIGFDANATNARTDLGLSNTEYLKDHYLPVQWPDVIEDSECSALWQKANGKYPPRFRFLSRMMRRIAHTAMDTLGGKKP